MLEIEEISEKLGYVSDSSSIFQTYCQQDQPTSGLDGFFFLASVAKMSCVPRALVLFANRNRG